MKKVIISIINFYQKNISGELSNKGTNCKFFPTCSDYTKEALEKYGTIKGLLLGIKRIVRCNPVSKGGYDPLR